EFADFAAGEEVAHAADFPAELDAVRVAHHPTDRLADGLHFEGARLAHVDEEVRVHLAHLGAAEDEAAAAGRVDQLPARMALGVLEGGTGGPGAGRLRTFAPLGHRAHLGEDLPGITRKALVDRRSEHRAARPVRLAIDVAHIGIAERDDLALPGDGAQLHHAGARLGAVAAGIHVERAADAAGNAAIEPQPVQAG